VEPMLDCGKDNRGGAAHRRAAGHPILYSYCAGSSLVFVAVSGMGAADWLEAGKQLRRISTLLCFECGL